MTQLRRELRECVLLTGVALLLSAACGSAQSDLFDRQSGGRAGASGGTSGSSGTNAGVGGGAQAGAGALGSGGDSLAGAGPDAGSGGTPEEPPTGGTAGAAGRGGSAGSGTTAGRGGMAGSGGTAGRGGSGGTAGRAGAGGTAGRGGTSACESETEACDGIDNDCDGGIDEAATCEAGCEGQVINGQAYMFCLVQSSTFATAAARCADERMHLVWIESAAENASILGTILAADVPIEGVWIGAADRAQEGAWGWVVNLPDVGTPFWSGRSLAEGGEPVMGRYANWGILRPNTGGSSTEDCATMTLDRLDLEPGTWNDDLCGDPFPFVCER